MLTNPEIGHRIYERRMEKGLTLQAVADKVHVQNSTIYRYEKGDISKIKLPIIESIATALDVTPGYLLDKPDYPLSSDQQSTLLNIFDCGCISKGWSHAFAINDAKLQHNFFPRLEKSMLFHARMYDLLAVAKKLEVYLEVNNLLVIPPVQSCDASALVLSPEAQKIAAAYDKATAKEQQLVRLALSDYLAQEPVPIAALSRDGSPIDFSGVNLDADAPDFIPGPELP